MRLLPALLVLAACEVPPLTVRFSLTDGTSQQCISPSSGMVTTKCSDITYSAAAECLPVLSIRIVPPANPELPYVSVCEPFRTSMRRELCGIAAFDIPQPARPIPEQVLEVQMAVFPRGALESDEDGKPICPIVEFGVDGLPVTAADCSDPMAANCAARVAVGGRAFYHPGDSETWIELGCTELELLNGKDCTGAPTKVIATVNEFESQTSVDLATANRLVLSIGEPQPSAPGSVALDTTQTHGLTRVVAASLPSWDGDFVDLGLTSSYCIEVLDGGPIVTRTLSCRGTLPNPERIDVTATRLKPETLSTIVRALYGPVAPFPSRGLVVGIVLNQMFSPEADVNVMCQSPTGTCTVKYLSADKLSFTTGNVTTSSGIWVSDDAPYGTTFSRMGQIVPSFGGLVDNNVTTVVLQDPTVGP